MEIKAGNYTAKIIAYGTKKTAAGEGAIVIQFGFDCEGESTSLSWQGSTKNVGMGKKTALQITCETLETCGFNWASASVARDFAALENGTASGMLDTDQEVSVKVEHEAGTDGNMYPRIRWVNKLGGGAFKNMMARGESAQAFAGITGDLLAFAASRGAKKAPAAIPTFDEIPF
jgi:hypothetical protein